MNAIYKGKQVDIKGKKVKIIKLNLHRSEHITHPILYQVKIEWKENGVVYEDWCDANDIEFINE